MEKDNIVSEKEAREYIDQFVEDYTDKYLQLKSLTDQNQSIQDAVLSQIKYGVSFVKGYVKDEIEEKKERVKTKCSTI